MGVALCFTQEQLDVIDSEYDTVDLKKKVLFVQWSMRDGKGTTYLKLAKLLFAAELLDLLQELCVLMAKLTPAGQYLCEISCYSI